MNQRPAPDAINVAEPVYAVRLLPDVREALQEFAATQNQKPETIIAEAVRGYLGLAE